MKLIQKSKASDIKETRASRKPEKTENPRKTPRLFSNALPKKSHGSRKISMKKPELMLVLFSKEFSKKISRIFTLHFRKKKFQNLKLIWETELKPEFLASLKSANVPGIATKYMFP